MNSLDIPEVNEPLIKMRQPNEQLLIYEGELLLRSANAEYKARGTLRFVWFPSLEVRISANLENHSAESFKWLQTNPQIEVFIHELLVGSVMISKISLSPEIHGLIKQRCVLGDKSIDVNYLQFEIPNLKNYEANPAKSGNRFYNARIHLENDKYLIDLDKRSNYKDLYESLEAEGGYITTYTGRLQHKKNSISFVDAKAVLKRLSFFLSFITGRTVSPLFIAGVADSEIIWRDWTAYINQPYQYVPVWSLTHQEFNSLWNSYENLCDNKEDEKCISDAIHWYLEANFSGVFAETAIVIIQNALELLYNWLVVEKNRIIIGEDAKNISASNKIRLLLTTLKLKSDMPPTFTDLASVSHGLDGPEAFVQLRNALVHSQEEKRKKIEAYNSSARVQALTLGIWYTELALLFILNYNGQYRNRCSESGWESQATEWVPWVSTAQLHPA